ncbi:hypothetical protein ACE38W_11555 [Chitinophaga sp. Hz27]|uniref:hypothetical protein n=1 Tax=Chitinophaga sp. Hz27 TaxID=3347169 RepID=UPI0035E0FCF0
MTPKILLVSLFILLASCHEPTFSERYNQQWREPQGQEFITIGRALVKNDIRVCGEYYVRKSSLDPGEYVVGCTPDGEKFEYFLVWTSTEKVTPIAATEIDIAPEGSK